MRRRRAPLSVRARIEAFPACERLEHALVLLDAAYGGETDVAALQVALRLTSAEARLAAALSARAPGVLTRDAALLALNPEPGAIDGNTVDVYLWRLRRRGLRIVNERGLGWRLEAPLLLRESAHA